MKYSLGPWRFHPDYVNNKPTLIDDEKFGAWQAHDMPIVDANGEILAQAVSWTLSNVGHNRVKTSEQMLVNARLIVDTPALLSVLKLLVTLKDNKPIDYNKQKEDAWKEARRLVNKHLPGGLT